MAYTGPPKPLAADTIVEMTSGDATNCGFQILKGSRADTVSVWATTGAAPDGTDAAFEYAPPDGELMGAVTRFSPTASVDRVFMRANGGKAVVMWMDDA